jgi:putative addiction module component (TIGR02574 family)
MTSTTLRALLELSADERAELALALWESLSPEAKDAELEVSPELALELDRRWNEHLQQPDAAIPWETVKKRLNDG